MQQILVGSTSGKLKSCGARELPSRSPSIYLQSFRYGLCLFCFVWLLACPILLAMFTRHDRDGLDQGKYGWASVEFSHAWMEIVEVVQVRAQMIKHMSEVIRYASSRYHAKPRVVYHRAVKGGSTNKQIAATFSDTRNLTSGLQSNVCCPAFIPRTYRRLDSRQGKWSGTVREARY